MMIPSNWVVPSHAVLVTTRPTYQYPAGTPGLYVGNAIRTKLGLPAADEASCNDLCNSLKSQRGFKIGWHGGVPKHRVGDDSNVTILVQTSFPDVDVGKARCEIIVADMGSQEGLVQVILVYKL
jgi:hypothetical protein